MHHTTHQMQLKSICNIYIRCAYIQVLHSVRVNKEGYLYGEVAQYELKRSCLMLTELIYIANYLQ